MDKSDEIYARGLATRQAVLGRQHVEEAQANVTPLTEEWMDFVTRYAFGEIWSRPGLPHKTRSMLSIVLLTALGRHEELANLAVYLLADQSEYITGEIIAIDGGQSLNGAGGFGRLAKLSDQDWAEIRENIRSVNAKGKAKRAVWPPGKPVPRRGSAIKCAVDISGGMWIRAGKSFG